jgi:hypothetical protein
MIKGDVAQAVATLSQRLATLEDQWTNLANFHVSVERLYLAESRDDALAAVVEIVANLVGSEEVAIFEKTDDCLHLLLASGVPAEPLRKIPLGTGLIGSVASTGHRIVLDSPPQPNMSTPERYEQTLTACVPLLVRGQVTGTVAVFAMLPQKPCLSTFDPALFEILENHAGQALYLATVLPPQRADATS